MWLFVVMVVVLKRPAPLPSSIEMPKFSTTIFFNLLFINR